jgi:pimeloyl-ACP methyl ester carboxylesterase
MRIEAHAIAGLGGWLFDRGTRALDKLLDEMSPVWDCTHWQEGQWEKAYDAILARAKTHKDKPKIILIGHSYGCLRAIQIARRLREINMRVAYIAAIDPTAITRKEPPMTIPNNVDWVDEFWASSGFPAAARNREPDGSAGGRYVVPAGMEKRHTLAKYPVRHIPLASHPPVVSAIVGRVREIVRQ